ncbi:hypothetical protein BHE74_00029207 [Ensete ventricosum]|nr:hypothetical protein BHE74_00029207 [Ensete ventricosum]
MATSRWETDRGGRGTRATASNADVAPSLHVPLSALSTPWEVVLSQWLVERRIRHSKYHKKSKKIKIREREFGGGGGRIEILGGRGFLEGGCIQNSGSNRSRAVGMATPFAGDGVLALMPQEVVNSIDPAPSSPPQPAEKPLTESPGKSPILVFVYFQKAIQSELDRLHYDAVLPLARLRFSPEKQRKLLFKSLCVMPLKLLECVLPWFVANLSDEEARSFLRNMHLAGWLSSCIFILYFCCNFLLFCNDPCKVYVL